MNSDMEKSIITKIAEDYLKDKELFLVDVKISKDNDIEVTIESESNSVNLDDCVKMSRHIESCLDREKEDFALTVGSAGLSSPFKVFGQYKKAIGQDVEITLANGSKLKGVLTDANQDSVILTHIVNQKVEGQKKCVKTEVTETLPLKELKSTKLIIRFK